MIGNWPTVRLGDYVDSCLGKMLDKEKNRGDFYPYLGNKNVRWGCFDTKDLAQMRFETHEHERYGIKKGDLVICEGGEPGRCAIWKDEIPGMKIQKALHRIRPNKKLDNRFLYYWFLLSGRNGSLEQYFTGTTIKHLTGKAIEELELPLPPKPVQEAIAHILGSLDDKIELNRRMNTTLEAMAQALFKSWFVDFDPVIDNCLAVGHPIPEPLQERAEARAALGDQRQPLPEAIRQQFPNRFVCNEDMGWVPEGWEVVNLTELATKISKGTTPRKEDIPADMLTEGIPFIKVKDITDNGEVILCGLDRIPRSVHEGVLRRSILRHGDILFSIAGTIGRCSIVPKELDDSNTNQAVAFIRPKSTKYTFFIFQHLKSEKVQGIVLSRVIHAVQANFSLTELGLLKLLVPSHEAVESWHKTTQPTLQKIELLRSENNHLATIRDTLLPKLLSGQLRIPEAEQQVADML